MKVIDYQPGVIRFIDEGRWGTFFRIKGTPSEQVDIAFNLLAQEKISSPVYEINMEGIDYIATNTSVALVWGALTISRLHQIPVIFTQALGEVWVGLRYAPLSLEDRYLWIVNPQGNVEVIGTLPDRFKEIINILKTKKNITASELPEIWGEAANKKSIGNASVYLQSMFNAGLLLRNKITGTERGSRGWTYSYSLPSDAICETKK